MLLLLYPNNELRARIPAPVPIKKTSGVTSLNLVNRAKLAISDLPPVEACKYPSCPWPRAGYGGSPVLRPFSVYARRQLARAGGVFAPADEGRLVFLTGTLPGSTPEAFKALSDHSSWVVHELITRIPRLLGCVPSELRWLWVWEWQKRGALHWHCVLECPSAFAADFLCFEFRSVWISVMRGLAKRSGVDVARKDSAITWRDRTEIWKIDAQIGYASPQQYLSKYLSKDDSKGLGESFPPPCRWYGASRRILRELREQTVFVDTHLETKEPSHVLSEQDCRFLGEFASLSSKVVAFVDKVKTGSTIVFYPLLDKIAVFRALVEEEVMGLSDVFSVWKKLAQNAHLSEKLVRWEWIDKVGSSSFLCEKLYADIGDFYRQELEDYLMGLPCNHEELWWINKYAGELLIRAGYMASVNSEAPPLGGLTAESPKKLEDGGGVQHENEYPGLPF